ncbi:MAG: aspartate--tRNA ligase [bacterium]|nr:aspartate--tRNA ligase [bacterium]
MTALKRTWIKDLPQKQDQEVALYGWAETIRDHGQITFIDLKDKTGLVQLVGYKLDPKPTLYAPIQVIGQVKARPPKLVNPKLPTGRIEVSIKDLKILNSTKPLPFPIDTPGYEIDEAVKLKYRYLDLRRPRLFNNLQKRSQIIDHIRQYLFRHDFLEIETPILTKSTPEGARDFLVPSRLQPGKFYALPQSPQQYKQLLMVAALERYFQIARCLRDEDPRADRGFEFTQLDLEMSFVTQEDVMNLTEAMLIEIAEAAGLKILHKPFPRFTYKQALEKYQADKFDMRKDKQKGVLAFAWVTHFPFFEKTDDGGWTFTHNPFSQPIPEHEQDLLKAENIGQITTTQYDLVCNGYEVGGGSIRSHKPEVLQAVFKILGYSKQQIQQKFGHMLEALSFGAPPHGGIALGLDRLIAIFQDEPSIKEVMAFPMSSSGATSVMDAPSKVDPQQLKELHLQIIQPKKKKRC